MDLPGLVLFDLKIKNSMAFVYIKFCNQMTQLLLAYH